MKQKKTDVLKKAIEVFQSIKKEVDTNTSGKIRTSESEPYLLERYEVDCHLWIVIFPALIDNGKNANFHRKIFLRDDNLEPIAYRSIMSRMTRPMPIKKDTNGNYYIEYDELI